MRNARLLPFVALSLTIGLAAPTAPAHQPQERGAPGVLVRFFEVDQPLRELPELVAGELPNAITIVPQIDLDGSRGDFGPMADNFVTEVTGFISVTTAGQYTFRLISDDGSRLWIDQYQVIDHDGPHGAVPKDGQIRLSVGDHAFRILHFDAGGEERLSLLWKPPGAPKDAEFVVVPETALRRDPNASRETSPGKKRVIMPLRRGRAGDGSPILTPHPGFEPVFRVMASGELDIWLVDGRLRVMGMPQRIGLKPVVAWLPALEGGVIYEFVWQVAEQGPYHGHLIVAPDEHAEAKRVWLDDPVMPAQGCAFRFGVADPSVQAIGSPPFEMVAVRPLTNGLELEFTKPLDPRVGWEAESYYIEQWPFDLAQGRGPVRDGTTTAVKSASVSPDRRKVFLEIDGLKTGHVVYVRLLPPCLSEDGQLPWSTEAWLTLNDIPQGRPGEVRPPPAPEPQNILTDEERAAGWKLLFDGRTTAGWRGYKKDTFPEGWQIINGCLVRVGPGGDLITQEQFDNFELSLEWRISSGGNSGIFFRVDESLGWPWESGPEMQVLDNAEHPDGQSARTSAGSNYALHAPIRDVTQPVGLFNQARIVARGNHVEHWLNGVKIVEYEIGTPGWEELVAASKFKNLSRYGRVAKGHIVLQDHGDKVWYRNIKIRPLPVE